MSESRLALESLSEQEITDILTVWQKKHPRADGNRHRLVALKYKSGMKQRDIARGFGVSSERIRQTLNKVERILKWNMEMMQ